MSKQYTFAETKDSYTKLWNGCTVTRPLDAETEARKIIKFKERYKQIEVKTGVPWFCIGIIHMREAGSVDVGRWLSTLHNGQKIIGTGRKTTIVPVGKGPFASFDEAAVDALKGYKNSKWSPEFLAYTLEKFNGFGYRNKGMPSPYLWGSTNRQTPGKYVADHVFDRNVMDTQVGGMALLKSLMKLDTSVNFNAPLPSGAGTAGTVLAGSATAGALAPESWFTWTHIIELGLGIAAVAIVIEVLVHLYNKGKQNV